MNEKKKLKDLRFSKILFPSQLNCNSSQVLRHQMKNRYYTLVKE